MHINLSTVLLQIALYIQLSVANRKLYFLKNKKAYYFQQPD